jgi:hypothetical protein
VYYAGYAGLYFGGYFGLFSDKPQPSTGGGYSRRKYKKWITHLRYVKSLKPSQIKRNIKKLAEIAREINASTPLIYQAASNPSAIINNKDLERELRLINAIINGLKMQYDIQQHNNLAVLLLI